MNTAKDHIPCPQGLEKKKKKRNEKKNCSFFFFFNGNYLNTTEGNLQMTNYSGSMEGSKISEALQGQWCPDFESVKELVTTLLSE